MSRLAAQLLPRGRIRLGRPRLPLRILGLLAATAIVLGAGWMWLRDSGLVRVKDVRVTGVSSSEGARVRAALEAAATQMSTLNVRLAELNDAVSGFSSVASLSVRTDFPHGMTIEVQERRPVAAIRFAGEVIAVGAGGRLMRGLKPARSLVVVDASRVAPGGQVTDRRAMIAVDVLAAAPDSLRARTSRVYMSDRKGFVLQLRDGPQVIFGDATDARAKWVATARVLAEPSAAGAVYLDVRIPERVAAGGLGTVEEEPEDPVPADPQAQPLNPQPQPENTPTLNQ